MTKNLTRPYTVLLNGLSHDRGETLGLYEENRTFRHARAAYGCALDFVLHGPKTNVALVRLHDKPFLRIERKGGWITTVEVNWSGEGDCAE